MKTAHVILALLATAGSLLAAEFLGMISNDLARDLPRPYGIIDHSEYNSLVVADSADLKEFLALGGTFLDLDPGERLYFRVRIPEDSARANYAAIGSKLYCRLQPSRDTTRFRLQEIGPIVGTDRGEYIVRVDPKHVPRLHALGELAHLGEQRRISTLPRGHVTLTGSVFTLVFASLVVAVLWWLLAVPPQVAAVVAHAHRVVSAIHRIVVPTNMHTNWERAVELACRLGEDQKAEILLTYVIEIPYTLSLGAPLERAEKTGKEIMARAAEIVEHHGLPVRTKIERARLAGEGIVRLARDEEADLIVIATPRGGTRVPALQGRTIEILLHRAPCEVIIDAVTDRTEEEPAVLAEEKSETSPPAKSEEA
jgi:nucleotide-binding universal stress UspA family protein